MILPDFMLRSRVNETCNSSGMDSRQECLDKKYFDNYPNQVIYQYNSRGFRDAEWPELTDLIDSIWCIGDSFTIGLGSPINHTWPAILKSASKKNTINISMNGASNDWITRKTLRIMDEISPKNIVIQWSFFSRVESDEVTLSDEDRRKHFASDKISLKYDFANFKKNLSLVESAKSNTNIIHSFVPNAFVLPELKKLWDQLRGSSWPIRPPENIKDLHKLDHKIISELINEDQFDNFEMYFELYELLRNINVVNYKQVDFARDSFHYDIKTATNLVDGILVLLE